MCVEAELRCEYLTTELINSQEENKALNEKLQLLLSKLAKYEDVSSLQSDLEVKKEVNIEPDGQLDNTADSKAVNKTDIKVDNKLDRKMDKITSNESKISKSLDTAKMIDNIVNG